MSANNQILVKQYKGKWYVFDNVMAESWSKMNYLDISEAVKVFSTKTRAVLFAFKLDGKINEITYGTEYGVHQYLAKDGAEVHLTDKKAKKKKTD